MLTIRLFADPAASGLAFAFLTQPGPLWGFDVSLSPPPPPTAQRYLPLVTPGNGRILILSVAAG